MERKRKTENGEGGEMRIPNSSEEPLGEKRFRRYFLDGLQA